MPSSNPALPLLQRLLAVLSTLNLPLIALLLGAVLPQAVTAGSISADGWELIDPLPQTNSLNGVTWGGGQFVAVGWNGTIITSPDGRQWTVRASPTTSILTAVTWNPSGYIAVGDDGTIIFSNDGISWEPRPSGFTGLLSDVTASSNRFVIVGDDGFLVSGTGNGSWETGQLGTIRHSTAQWNGTQFLVGNEDGQIATSTDDLDWSEFRNVIPCLSDVAWNGAVYAAIGDLGCYGVPTAEPENFIHLLNGNGAFLAYAYDGNGRLNAAAWDGNRFIVIGSLGRILSSPTGSNWSAMQSGVDLSLGDIAVSDTSSVVVGEAGVILVRSTPASSASNPIPTLSLIPTLLLVAAVFLAALRRGKLLRDASLSIIVTVALAVFASPSAMATGQPTTDPIPRELIVLLQPRSHGTPSAREIIELHQNNHQIPGEIGIGNPTRIEFALSHRPEIDSVETDEEYENAEIRLSQYLTLKYPPVVNIDAIEQALSHNPNILSVEKNDLFQFSASVNDPYFAYRVTYPNPVPTQFPHLPPLPEYHYQWGLHALNIPLAWEYATGHATTGLIENGSQTNHPDLKPVNSNGLSIGGNLRTHLSWGFWFGEYDDCDVNFGQPQSIQCIDESSPDSPGAPYRGHGTMVSGIVGATPNNNMGVIGACQHCSLLVTRGYAAESWGPGTIDTATNSYISRSAATNALMWHVNHGAQVVNMSFGKQAGKCDNPNPQDDNPFTIFCSALTVAIERDVILVAAAGNDKESSVQFPAVLPFVISVGGIEPDLDLWDNDNGEAGELCPSQLPFNTEFKLNEQCGSNTGAELDLVAPAQGILSTTYEGFDLNPNIPCTNTKIDPTTGENYFGTGYDLCSGTSFAAPYVTAIIGLLRSVNPLLDKPSVEYLLTSNASQANNRTNTMGYGVPDAEASVIAALGTVNGIIVDNRLTPLFSLYNTDDHLYTTNPQLANAAINQRYYGENLNVYMQEYESELERAIEISGYSNFPYVDCHFSETSGIYCRYGSIPKDRCYSPSCKPRAEAFILASDRSPLSNVLLVPLYRLSYEHFDNAATTNINEYRTGHAYASNIAQINSFLSNGYRVDGIEGYLFLTDPGQGYFGPEQLFMRHNTTTMEYILVLEGNVTDELKAKYPVNDGALGYAYPNADRDQDNLIDGFELLIRTDPTDNDSDNDGMIDGDPNEYPLNGIPKHDPKCDDTILTGMTLSGNLSYSGCAIELGADGVGLSLTISQTSDIDFHATRSIRFSAGTRIEEGASVTATISTP